MNHYFQSPANTHTFSNHTINVKYTVKYNFQIDSAPSRNNFQGFRLILINPRELI